MSKKKKDDLFVEEDDLETLLESKKDQEKQVEKNDDNEKYRYSTVSLPSKGKNGYPEDIEYRDILVKDEKILSSSTEKTFSKSLNSVLKSLLKDDSFYNEMTIYDRDFLLIWVWANNYSTNKTIEMKCPHCSKKNIYDIDLTKLEIKELDDDYKTSYPYTTKAGENVFFKLLTVNDEAVARDFCNMNSDYDDVLVSMCLSVNLGTVMPLADKIKHIENNFTGKDMSILRGFHKHFKYGVVDSIDKECSGCGEVNLISIPFQVEFFIPSLSDDFR